jgi:phosphate transport system permease protein
MTTTTTTSATPSATPSPAPRAPASPDPKRAVPRKVRMLTFDDWMSLWGSVLSSLALVTITYEHLLDGSGTLGFLVVWYLTFLVLYAAVVALSNSRPVVVDRLVTTALWAAAAVVIFALGTTVVYTVHRGWPAVHHVNFYTKTMSGVRPTAPLTQGGILHAIAGTGIEVGIAVAISVPLGLGTAVYMSEVGGRLSRLVRTVVEAMTALPEILAGLFVYAVLILDLGVQKSGFAAAVGMAVTMVPIMARAAEVALRVVPGGLREASLALGASKWRTVRKVVLPSAKAGLATAIILGVARGIGETAVVLIASGANGFLNLNPFNHEMNSLPLFILTSEKTGEPLAVTRAFGAAVVLLAIVVILFVLTRVFSRDKSVRR